MYVFIKSDVKVTQIIQMSSNGLSQPVWVPPVVSTESGSSQRLNLNWEQPREMKEELGKGEATAKKSLGKLNNVVPDDNNAVMSVCPYCSKMIADFDVHLKRVID